MTSHSRLYDNMRASLEEDEKSSAQAAHHIGLEISLRQAMNKQLVEQLGSDSVLHASGVLSQDVLDDKWQSIRMSEIQTYELMNAYSAKLSDISKKPRRQGPCGTQ